MTTIPDPYLNLDRACQLLAAANKWVRMVEERREDVPHWFRHGADPTPLRRAIDSFRHDYKNS